MADKPIRDILVTSALPYANGPLHLGHLLEQVQTDIWVRFQRSRGHDCLYVCADDAHGTAIMLAAEKLGITPEEHIGTIHAHHAQDSAAFLIDFANFHSTHSEENRHWSEEIYRRLKANNHIDTREITQAFDPDKNLFLAETSGARARRSPGPGAARADHRTRHAARPGTRRAVPALQLRAHVEHSGAARG